VADHPLRPATDHRLGRPLPHQQANPTRAPPLAINLSRMPLSRHPAYAVLAEVSLGYPPQEGRFPRATHPCATPRAETRSVRLACVKHAASVRSEPGSNSHVQSRQSRHLTGNGSSSQARTPHRARTQSRAIKRSRRNAPRTPVAHATRPRAASRPREQQHPRRRPRIPSLFIMRNSALYISVEPSRQAVPKREAARPGPFRGTGNFPPGSGISRRVPPAASP
jgi:hypothetical protein